MSGMRKETEKKYKEICRLVRAGRSNDEIAEELCCSRSTVDRAISLYGGRQKRETFEAHKDEIIAMYRKGMILGEIETRTGLSVHTIVRNMRKLGIRRGKGWKPADYRQRNRTGTYTQAEPEQELELFPLTYAQHTRKAERIVIRGKSYIDVSAWYM